MQDCHKSHLYQEKCATWYFYLFFLIEATSGFKWFEPSQSDIVTIRGAARDFGPHEKNET